MAASDAGQITATVSAAQSHSETVTVDSGTVTASHTDPSELEESVRVSRPTASTGT